MKVNFSNIVTCQRQIIIGRNSKVWTELVNSGLLIKINIIAISHAELSSFEFLNNDIVWVLSYSKDLDENKSMLDYLKCVDVESIVYVTSASTIVLNKTKCYQYPRLKRETHRYARNICDAKILSIGLVYSDASEIPGGVIAATSVQDLARFIVNPKWNEHGTTFFFKMVEGKFKNKLEAFAYKVYGLLQFVCGPYPCLLRPVDYFLRYLNARWYGYFFLSNKIWSMKILYSVLD